MRADVAGTWTDDFLDYHRPRDSYRIGVARWVRLGPVDGMYFVRPASPLLVLNYLRVLGLRETLRKVASRRAERARNEKYVACGVGTVLEAPDGAARAVGSLVRFVAPRHPRCVERLVLPPALVWDASPDDTVDATVIRATDAPASDCWWNAIAGWDADSGEPLDLVHLRAVRRRADELLRSIDWSGTSRLERGPHGAPRERSATTPGEAAHGDRRAILVGYGNYAKTVVLPSLPKGIRTVAVHEIDPMQHPRDGGDRVTWDTAPAPRDDLPHDLVIVAGFHHSHADIAAQALRAGRDVLVEKPLAVDRRQLRDVVDAMSATRGRLFAGFQKRYSPLNALTRHDLEAPAGTPLSYHCIVYEVPLPPRHWYRWPRSGSALVSNGCHWIDHFLYLNDFPAVRDAVVSLATDHALAVTLQADSGAVFSMVLTSQGSDRLGVREHVEIRAGRRTVTIDDARFYRAESSSRVVRSTRIGRLTPYRAMYREIGRRILVGEAGDDVRSVQRSVEAVLRLEEQVQQARRRPAGASPLLDEAAS